MKATLLFCLLIVCSTNSHAQLFKKLKAKISEKIETVIDEKINKSRRTKEIEDEKSQPQKEETSKKTSSESNNTIVNESISEEVNNSDNYSQYETEMPKTVNKIYDFDTKITFKYVTNNLTNSYQLLQKTDANYYAMSFTGAQETQTITIREGKLGVTLMQTTKGKVQIPNGNMQDATSNIKDNPELLKRLKKTGQSKIILGYKADQYTLVDDKGAKIELWAAKDLKMKNAVLGTQPTIIQGYILEMASDNKEEKMTSTATRIQKENIRYNTSEYKSMFNFKH